MTAERGKAAGVVLRHARNPDDLAACFPVIAELRPRLKSVEMWLEHAAVMTPEVYRVLAAWRGDRALALAGYRMMRNLIHGRFLCVDDLVSAAAERGAGLGSALLQELSTIGAAAGVTCLRLDTAADNTDARRFYARRRPPRSGGRLRKAAAAGSMTVLVTGGAGLLGRSVIDVLRARDLPARACGRSVAPPGLSIEWRRADLVSGEGVDAAMARSPRTMRRWLTR